MPFGERRSYLCPGTLGVLSFYAMNKPVRAKCPVCKKEGDWFAAPYGPFCSRRCKLVDLGKWLGEEHRISQPLRPEHLEPKAPPGSDEI